MNNLELLFKHPIRFEYLECGIARLPEGHCTNWRIQPSLMLSLARSGEAHLELSDGQTFCARDGGLLILPAGIRHRVTVFSPEECRVWVHVNYSFLDSLSLFSFVQLPYQLPGSLAEEIGDFMERKVLAPPPSGKMAAVEKAAEENEFGFHLLRLLVPFMRTREERMAGVNRLEFFQPVLEYMTRHLAEPQSRDQLAEIAGLSPTRFHLLFKETFGKTPMRFLRDLRLRRAQLLLLAGRNRQLSIADVGRQCGYADPFVFCKIFHSRVGQSPTEYRRDKIENAAHAADPALNGNRP